MALRSENLKSPRLRVWDSRGCSSLRVLLKLYIMVCECVEKTRFAIISALGDRAAKSPALCLIPQRISGNEKVITPGKWKGCRCCCWSDAPSDLTSARARAWLNDLVGASEWNCAEQPSETQLTWEMVCETADDEHSCGYSTKKAVLEVVSTPAAP
jgi:hypothetical protein